jgi:hypothetical protein
MHQAPPPSFESPRIAGVLAELSLASRFDSTPRGSVLRTVETGPEISIASLQESRSLLDRLQATCAALIPIRKTASWWTLAQDERRRIFEESSKHVKTGLKYLPAVARRLHHCRDLGENEPFDFLTWFEYAFSDSAAFDELVAELRSSEEWAYVDREIDIRVVHDGAWDQV